VLLFNKVWLGRVNKLAAGYNTCGTIERNNSPAGIFGNNITLCGGYVVCMEIISYNFESRTKKYISSLAGSHNSYYILRRSI
jgi:hypothetical protein